MRATRKNICILLALTLLCGCGGAPSPASPTAAPAQGTAAPTAAPTPVPTPTPTPTPTPEPTPVLPPLLPEAARVEDDYFADAVFFGNSLVDGLHISGKLKSTYIAENSATVLSVSRTLTTSNSQGRPCTLLDRMLEQPYGKVYFLFGVNELGFPLENFITLYGDLLDTVAAALPDAVLYIMSLTPVTREKSETDDVFTRAQVEVFNQALYDLAKDRGCCYLDIYAALADEDGWLEENGSFDGVHLEPYMYPRWTDYLRTHYVPAPASEDAPVTKN